ncbi:hypothetical protein [Duganella vulcania]|uniref:Lipocalin-like domain-containing protein n=1 Tax=Duganella vulcania TaxID=2692166 RepID=A0A845GKV7_9BURK|nr:hypothetical protein [Duganella vulcania]MYM94005.1 hypothetical protein [Duganella vulcania]
MHNKVIFAALLLCSSLSQAFDGAPSFTAKRAGIEHTLKLSQWKVDGKGVPSFDYVYEQQAAGCRLKVVGRATAGFEEKGGKVVLDVFNPEDGKGKALPQILMFYDDTVTLTLPLKGTLQQVSFDDELTDAQLRGSCGKKSDAKLSVLFRQ